MLSSGSRSYYEDYVRKKDTDRAFAKPPALLTDRNAYINFLEVQLERVSSACFSVQAYEQRFNDMQGLIVALDERCSSTARLVTLAQQCTEEVRAEAHQRLEMECKANKNIRSETQKTSMMITEKLGRLEKSICILPQLDAKVTALEKRCNEFETIQRNSDLDYRILHQETTERINNLDSIKNELYALIESTRASISRVTFDVEENTTRVNSYINTVEERITNILQTNKENITHELASLQAKYSNQNDELRRLIDSREQETIITTRKQFQLLSDELESSKRRWTEDHESLSKQMKEDVDRKINSIQYNITQSVNQIRTSQNKQASFMCDLEETLSSQMEHLHTNMKNVSNTQRNVQKEVHTVQKSVSTVQKDVNTVQKELETQLEQVRTSLTLSPQRASTPVGWSHPASSLPLGAETSSERIAAGIWAADNTTAGRTMGTGSGVQQSHSGAAYVHPSTDFTRLQMPLSPVQRSFDTSFFSPGPLEPGSVAPGTIGQSGTASHSAAPILTSATSSSSLLWPSERELRAAGTSRVDTQRSRSTSPYSNSAAHSRSTSPSQSRVQSRRIGTSQSHKKRPVGESAVDIIQKFLQIYEADQKEVAKRLDQLGAAKGMRSTSAIRRRLRTATAAVKNTLQSTTTAKPSHSDQQLPGSGRMRSKEKTPGEVLSSFFLNYKKDRKVLLERMDSLEAEKKIPKEVKEEVKEEVESSGGEVYSEEEEEEGGSGSETAGVWGEYKGIDGSQDNTGAGPLQRPHTQRQEDDIHQQVEYDQMSAVSSDPAGAVVETLLSRSMDGFLRNGNRSGRTAAAAASSSASPHRPLRSSSSYFSNIRDDSVLQPSKRYMGFTESMSISRSQSPVDPTAVLREGDYPPRPVWRVNTYSSPNRPRGTSAQPVSRSSSTSPGARTAAVLIERLTKRDRDRQQCFTAVDTTTAVAATADVLDTATQTVHTQSKPCTVATVVDNSDTASVVSTHTTSTTTSTYQHKK